MKAWGLGNVAHKLFSVTKWVQGCNGLFSRQDDWGSFLQREDRTYYSNVGYLWERSARNPLKPSGGAFPFLSPHYLPEFSFPAHAALFTLIIKRRLFLLRWFERGRKAAIDNFPEQKRFGSKLLLRSVIASSPQTEDADAFSPAVANR